MLLADIFEIKVDLQLKYKESAIYLHQFAKELESLGV